MIKSNKDYLYFVSKSKSTVHITLKCLSLVVIIIQMSSGWSFAQTSIQHEQPIRSLELDSTNQLIVRDVTAASYQLGLYELVSTTATPQKATKTEFQLWEGQLRKNIEDHYSLYPLPFVPASLYAHDDKVLIAGSDGLWLYNDGQVKRYYVPGVEIPSDLILVKAYDHYIGMVSRDKELFLYDTIHQTIKFVDSRVDDFIIDRWHCVFYSKGKILFNYQEQTNNQIPSLSIAAITSASGRILTHPITINSGEAIDIRYKSVYSPSMNRLESDYSINDGNWKPINNTKLLSLPSLPNGTNTIRIRTKGNKEHYAVSSPIKVKVASDSLGRFWPWLFGVLGLLFLISILSQSRLKNELKSLEAEKEKIRLHLQVSHEQQRLGQLQMNPHFLFNTLNSISGLIALNENKKARKHLASFSKMMRQLLDASQKEWITLGEELSFLESYLELEKMIRNDKFDYKIDSSLDTDTLIPPMILQPFLENAIIHGIKHRKRKGSLAMSLEENGKTIKVVIEDDGIGRKAASEHKQEGHESAALKIIEQRLRSLNKWDDLSLEYMDLEDASGTAQGTRVTVHLPNRKTL